MSLISSDDPSIKTLGNGKPNSIGVGLTFYNIMKRAALLLPFLFTFVSLLQLSYVASNVVSLDQILRPLIFSWILLGLLIWPAHRLTGSWEWTVLLLTVIILGFFSSSSLFSTTLGFVIIGSVLWLAFARLRRIKIKPQSFIVILGITALLLFGYATLSILTMLNRIPWAGYQQAVSDARNSTLNSLISPANKPDIYYIVLDGYARADILQEMFDFDNSKFIGYLQNKGFIIPSSNHSNYPATPLSISSTLNMEYIQTLVPALDKNYQRWLMAPFIDHSRVRALLEALGYQTVSISTNWTITDNPTTDHYFHPRPMMLTDFEGFVLDETPLHLLEPILGTFASLPNADSHREIIRYNFDTLATLPNLPGPKFVFAHIISPHPPFVFDKNGNPIAQHLGFTFQDANEFPGSLDEYPIRYVDQVQFVNDQVKKMVEAILTQSSTPPIIILQADHGSGMFTDLNSPENTCIHERFSPFAAYYMPGRDKNVIPSDMSNVNIFRIVFNQYFHANLPLLDSKQYFYKDTQTYYDFEDVSGRVDQQCIMPGK